MTDFPQAVGFLVVSVTAGQRALPLENALVTVSAPVDGRNVLYRVARTDRSGRTPIMELPAPAKSQSLTPDQVLPYSSYNVQVDLDGYQSAEVQGISIFPGIVTDLPVSLAPLTEERPPISINILPPEQLNTRGGGGQ